MQCLQLAWVPLLWSHCWHWSHANKHGTSDPNSNLILYLVDERFERHCCSEKMSLLQDHLLAFSQVSSMIFRISMMIGSIPNLVKPVGSISFSLFSLRGHMRKRSAPGNCADKGGKAPKGQSPWGETIYTTCKWLISQSPGLKPCLISIDQLWNCYGMESTSTSFTLEPRSLCSPDQHPVEWLLDELKLGVYEPLLTWLREFVPDFPDPSDFSLPVTRLLIMCCCNSQEHRKYMMISSQLMSSNATGIWQQICLQPLVHLRLTRSQWWKYRFSPSSTIVLPMDCRCCTIGFWSSKISSSRASRAGERQWKWNQLTRTWLGDLHLRLVWLRLWKDLEGYPWFFGASSEPTTTVSRWPILKKNLLAGWGLVANRSWASPKEVLCG